MNDTPDATLPVYRNELVKVEFEDGIAWVYFNRPEKRNAMSPSLNREMEEVLDKLEGDDRCKVLVLTGSGDAWSAGMDLKEFFREVMPLPTIQQQRIRNQTFHWQRKRLMYYLKPTIAMVNGWCFGGAFVPLVSCDLSLAAEDAQFGLSEINWGIIPGGNVTRSLAAKVNQADALYYIMTGEPFDGRKAKEMGLVNEVLPADKLRERTVQLAKILMAKNPVVLNAAKLAYKHADEMNWETAEDYLSAKAAQATLFDPTKGMMQGISQFLDDKSYKPGLGTYRIEEE
ncbi:MAG: p-hydroxycinnamoyl CoA hydratase/lyase [Rhodobacter sp.]|uniref:p-hydroxycinnamoyl CoA hydratase/lyase n=1 Tax=Pararhodobacter sp. TaxID=2127056 RepID=UPI001D25A693|nr:p-hydroxycinnamoyl CoA hydratase/lyase [Pararhodobacter sp.]MCB1343880.1 p-hydroxycinnamoyl CoA hydratase/lyase [Paracoccaceae bacterium]MCC0074923.1 p-hydroxycinnamoyl CoA hydratase/lyase [Rhodobacter sp.]HPD91373.1 p-hydroxycinnamoyl CoA hydratase/lyase [Pararhodobacter sp.]